MKTKCEECIYARRMDFPTENIGECRRRSPNNSASGHIYMWPRVNLERDWCGEGTKGVKRKEKEGR
jgi:hypothetical protein